MPKVLTFCNQALKTPVSEINERYGDFSPTTRNPAIRSWQGHFPLVILAIMGTLILLFFVVGFTLSGLVNHYQSVSARVESLGIVPPGFAVIPAAFSLLGAGIAEVSTKKSRRLA
jgi:hypothetical protein